MSEKKVYTPPTLIVHGSFAELTRQDGQAFVDVPQGTTNDGNVTGDPS